MLKKSFTQLALLFTLFISGTAFAAEMTVYKSPYCGCCKHWITHMKDNGFKLKVIDQENMYPIKQKLGIQPGLSSCHTAEIDGYVIEGHVPAADVKKLLTERPEVHGLAVPGMPVGSPGMEDPSGKRVDPYDVVAFTRDGKRYVFSKQNQSSIENTGSEHHHHAGDHKH